MAAPVTLNEAAVTVPAFAGRETPPVDDLVPAGVKTTVPPEEFTVTFPKSMSVAVVIEMGVTILTFAFNEIEACANAVVEIPIIMIGIPKKKLVLFTVFFFEFLF